MDKEYHVGDIVEITHVVDEIVEVNNKFRAFFHRKFDDVKYDFLLNGFLNLIEKKEVKRGEEVKIKFKITRFDEHVRIDNSRMFTMTNKEKFLEMMAFENS